MRFQRGLVRLGGWDAGSEGFLEGFFVGMGSAGEFEQIMGSFFP